LPFVIGVLTRAATEIDVARAKFSEIMSWDDWKAKARRLQYHRPDPDCLAKQGEQDIPVLTGMGDTGATTSEALAGNWRELCKRS
jgi:hypothetical protein